MAKKNIIDKDIILLEPICVTGRSFNICRNILIEFGAASVRCIALAREMDQALEYTYSKAPNKNKG
jgi:hypoxanthine-guanine phosphoribosyltransferase